MRRGMRSRGRSFGGSRGFRPSREWLGLQTTFGLAAVSVTTAVPLLSLQAPTTLALTADPPEDLTILRIVGEYSVTISQAAARWVLALIVQDVTWTPSATFNLDADKRILWSRTYISESATAAWSPPGQYSEAGAVVSNTVREAVSLDITPKQKVEAGRALYLVGYEEGGTSAIGVDTNNMRLLFQRSGRR